MSTEDIPKGSGSGDSEGNPEGNQVRVAITYCTQCGWMLRAAWMAQELLSTFGTDLGEVALRPGTGGVFTVEAGGVLVWERKRDGGFPDAPTLKQKVRDVAFPERALGHSERKSQG